MDIRRKISYIKYNKSKLGQTPPNSSGWNTFTEAIEKAAKAVKDFNASTGATQMGINAITTATNRVAQAFQNYQQKASILETRNEDLINTFGLNIEKAAKFGDSLDGLSKNFGIGGEAARKYTKNLAGLQNGFLNIDKGLTGFQKKLLQGQKYMTDQLKVTAEAAEGFEYYSATLADSGIEQLAIQNEISKAIETTTKMSGVQRDLTETIGSMAANLQLQYSRIPGSLELAILKSRALGLSMQDLNKTGESLLNIESSVGEELEYQLLTGRRLLTDDDESLTNAYRIATLQGDANKQAELMNKLIQDEGKTLENNLLARQQAAKMLGMDEATLARSIQKQKLITKLGAEELMRLNKGDMTKVAEQLKSQGVDEADISELLKASDTRTTQERMADTLDQILSKGIFTMTDGQASSIVKATSDGIQSAFESVVGGLSGTIAGPNVAQGVGMFASVQTIFGEGGSLVEHFGKLIPGLSGLVSELNDFVDKWVGIDIGNIVRSLDNFSDSVTSGGGLFVYTNTNTGVTQQDFLMRSNGTVVPFTSKDDIVGAKEGGPLAQALSTSTGGGGITDSQINKLANAIATAMQGVTIQTDPLYQGNNINGDRFA